MAPGRRRIELTSAALVASALVVLAALLSAAMGVAAVAGADWLTDNVDEIERTTGLTMYASLAAWGWLLVGLGLAEGAAAGALWRRTPNCVLAALTSSYFALAAAFFSLPIFRVAGLVLVTLLLVAVFLLSYHSRRTGVKPR